MELQIKYEFDPIFETLGLLYSSAQEDAKDEIVCRLCELGVDGEAFYRKYYRLIERYESIFKKYRTVSRHMDFFFRPEEKEFFLLLSVLLTENRHWFDSLDMITDRQLRNLIGFVIREDGESVTSLQTIPELHMDTEKDVIALLSALETDDESLKWHLLEFMQKPKYWLGILIDLVKNNIPAYEKALENMLGPLAPLMKSYEKYEDKQFQKLAQTCAPGSTVYPTFIAGVSQMVFYTQAYQGIFMEDLLKKNASGDEKKALLISRMKALSDKSKLDILCQLKKSDKYNLELAEAMHLSASTMSHHMSVLFACGFVGVDKKEGRVYYCLEEETVAECIDDLRRLLL